MYAFKFGDDSKNKLKGISKSQSKNIEFEEYYNCLFGGKHQQECDNYMIRSFNHQLYLQRVKKPTLSQFVDKRCYKTHWKYTVVLVLLNGCKNERRLRKEKTFWNWW